MSKETIPQSIIDKIKEAGKSFCKKQPINPDAINLKFSHPDYHMGALIAFNEGAKFALELDKWISVKDGLPEDSNDWYWCAKGESIMLMAYQYSKKHGWWPYGEPEPDTGITHYQYLPQAPSNIK